MPHPPDFADMGIPQATHRPTAHYGLDPRVEGLVGSFAVAVLQSARGVQLDEADLALLLRDLEELVCRAQEAEAGAVEMVERDGWPLFDAAGRALVAAMWSAITDDLAAIQWRRLTVTDVADGRASTASSRFRSFT